MTVKILMKFPGIAITEPSLQGLVDRARRHPNVTPDMAMGYLLAHVEQVLGEVDMLGGGLTGKVNALVHEDGTIGWVAE
jgi:hypothetical protein